MTLNPKLDPTCVLCLTWGEAGGSTAYDQSQYGNNGTIYGAARTSGRPRWALSFDGVDDYVYVPYSPSFDVQVFTLVAWAYYIPKTTSDSYIIYKPNINHHLSLYVESNTFIFVGAVTFTDGTTLFGKIDTRYAKSIANVFRMYALRYDGATFDVFIDATKYFTATVGKTVATGAYPLLVGARGASYFNGLIGEVRIYSRALSDKEIYTLYVYGLESLRKAPPLRGGGLEW